MAEITISGEMEVYFFDETFWDLLDDIEAHQRESIDEEGCGAVFGELVATWET